MAQIKRRAKLFLGFSAVLSILFFVVFAAGSLKAESPVDPWLVAGTPNLSSPQDLAPGRGFPPTVAGYGNVDCQMHKFVTRPASIGFSEKGHESCAVQTLYGLVDPNGYISLNGTKVAGKLKSSVGTDSLITPIPDSPNAIVLQSTSSGIKLHMYKNISRRLRVEKNILTGEFSYFLPETPSKTLRDPNGNDLFVRPESISFSSNGKWMVVDSQSIAMLRVNLETYQVTPFKSPYVYNLGQAPLPNTTISDDGKYAATTSRAKDLTIIDVDSCQTSPSTFLTFHSCSSKDHGPFVNSRIPGGLGASRLRFIDNRLLTFYASYTPTATTRQLAKYRLVPAGDSQSSVDYMALGDSFTSGEGAYDYFAETDTDENMCHLSRSSYPYLIGQQLELNSYNSVACSGAKIENINQYVQKENIPSPNSMGDLLPGYKRQLQYVKKYQPNVITVSVGGNDIGFGKSIIECVGYGVLPSTCYRYYEDRLEVLRLINKQFDRLVETFIQLKSGAKSGTKIYALGYPEEVKNNGNCAINVRLDNEEIEFSNLLIGYLNSVIERSATKAGVRYVDVSQAFSGHRLCETDSQFIAVNGLTAGDNRLGIIANEGFHPNKLGHQLFKLTILEQTSNFSQNMPAPDATVRPPTEDPSLPILQAPSSDRGTNDLQPDEDLTPDDIYKDNEQTLVLNSMQHSLKPNAEYKAEIHSDPTSLGIFTTNSEGDLSGTFTIPTNVEPGYHTVHIYGPNLNDEQIDIYKTVFIGASENDYDGDGVQNQQDTCPGDQNSGIDADNDGIDDACDDSIVIANNQPTTEPENPGLPSENTPTTDVPENPSPETPIPPEVGDGQPAAPPSQGEVSNPDPIIEDEPPTDNFTAPSGNADDTRVSDATNYQHNKQSSNYLSNTDPQLVEGVNQIASDDSKKAVAGDNTDSKPSNLFGKSSDIKEDPHKTTDSKIIIFVICALLLGIAIFIKPKRANQNN